MSPFCRPRFNPKERRARDAFPTALAILRAEIPNPTPHVKHIPLLFLLLSALVFSGKAQISLPQNTDTVPRPIKVTTTGTAEIGGKKIAYRAETGRMEISGPDRKPMALMGYTAYTLDGKKSGPGRPVIFAFNGGPGSSSIWLHMGALGPKRVRVNDPHPTPNAPYTLEDNKRSLIDMADVVMIDPVGTGISTAAGEKKEKDFWGVDEDIESISAFIRRYLLEKGLMNAPKYLLGESYGTFRSAGIMDYMQGKGIAFNGVIMVSAVFDLLTLTFSAGSDLSYPMFLPTYAATAHYHEKLIDRPDDLDAFLDEVRAFTETVYIPALYKGTRLAQSEKEKIADRLALYTGLSANFWFRADLRVKAGEFFAELLRDEGETVGRLDSRYRGMSQDLMSRTGEYDPFTTSLGLPYTAAFLDYYHRTLKADPTVEYHTSAYGKEGFKWNWEHKGNKSWGTVTSITTAPDMARTLTRNPHTKVLILNGLYDLGTPFYAVEYTLDHMGLKPEIRDNIYMKYYPSGHMMYTDEESFDAFERDVREFIRQTANIFGE